MAFDGEILLWIQDNIRGPILDSVFKFITSLANGGILWIAIIAILIISKKYRYVGIVSAFSLIICNLINTIIIKNIVQRTRPYEVVEGLNKIIDMDNSYSFPSGHTTVSFAVAIVIFMLMSKKYGISAIILATTIAFSRLYVGVHYPTDVLYAAISSVIMAVITVIIFNKLKEKGKFDRIIKRI